MASSVILIRGLLPRFRGDQIHRGRTTTLRATLLPTVTHRRTPRARHASTRPAVGRVGGCADLCVVPTRARGASSRASPARGPAGGCSAGAMATAATCAPPEFCVEFSLGHAQRGPSCPSASPAPSRPSSDRSAHLAYRLQDCSPRDPRRNATQKLTTATILLRPRHRPLLPLLMR